MKERGVFGLTDLQHSYDIAAGKTWRKMALRRDGALFGLGVTIGVSGADCPYISGELCKSALQVWYLVLYVASRTSFICEACITKYYL